MCLQTKGLFDSLPNGKVNTEEYLGTSVRFEPVFSPTDQPLKIPTVRPNQTWQGCKGMKYKISSRGQRPLATVPQLPRVEQRACSLKKAAHHQPEIGLTLRHEICVYFLTSLTATMAKHNPLTNNHMRTSSAERLAQARTRTGMHTHQDFPCHAASATSIFASLT